MRNKVNLLKRNLKSKAFCSTLDSNLPSKLLWRNIKNAGITKNIVNHAEAFSPSDFNNHFASVFAPPSSQKRFSTSMPRESDFEFTNVTNETTYNALFAISTNALGHDKIPAIFVKKMSPFIIPFLTLIINGCITISFFPTDWKSAVVKPIAKTKTPTTVEEFRPISILPCLSKVLERIMKDQIQEYASTNDLLYKYQSGFRNKLSTNTAILSVVHDLASAVESNHVTILCLLDLRKAFDLVDHNLMLLKLYTNFKFSRRSCAFIKSYLTGRQQKVEINDSSSNLINVTSGTPQGGILSALLFTLFINDL